MGFWSKIKKGLKKAWNFVKATVRVIVKVVIEIVYRVVNLLLVWLPIKKKIRIQILILRDENGVPLATDKDLQLALNFAITTFKDKFDVELKGYGKPIIQTLPNSAPTAALDVKCDGGALKNEFGEAGDFFSKNLAGWNLIPIHLGFPITVFVVRDVSGKIGCSLGPLSDYVTIDTIIEPGGTVSGITSDSNLTHELGHACFLLHRDNINNLMFPNHGRSNGVTKWQKFVVRNSRHCTFW